jgi:hypothetical protein
MSESTGLTSTYPLYSSLQAAGEEGEEEVVVVVMVKKKKKAKIYLVQTY